MVSKRVDLGQVLAGLSIHDFDGTPKHAYVLAKVYEDDVWGWSFRATRGLDESRLLGALRVQSATLRAELLNEWRDVPTETSVRGDESERVDAASRLAGLKVWPIDGRIDFAFVLLRVDSGDGVQWCMRTTSPPNREELLGALTVQEDYVLARLTESWSFS